MPRVPHHACPYSWVALHGLSPVFAAFIQALQTTSGRPADAAATPVRNV